MFSDHVLLVRPKTTTHNYVICGHCGGSYPHKGQCPAYQQQCRACGKSNHFVRCCRAQTRSISNPPSQQYRKVTHKFNQTGRYQTNRKQNVNKLSAPASSGTDDEFVYVILSCTILCSTAFCRLSNDSQRRITQRIDDVDGAAYRLHGQKLAGIAFNREWNNVGETASAAAAGNRFHSGMVRATNDPWSCAVTAPMARNLK